MLRSTIKLTAGIQLFLQFVGEIRSCYGPSMLPTFNEVGDFVYLDKLSPRFFGYKHGDVVVAYADNKQVCKRILGLEFDFVECNGKLLQVPLGHVWLCGDNQANSMDSRVYGPVPIKNIKARVVCRLFPDFSLV